MKKIEYRTRAVTRYVVTEYVAEDNTSTGSAVHTTIGEFDSLDQANKVGEALQGAANITNKTFQEATFTSLQPAGQKVRCKVVCTSNEPSVYNAAVKGDDPMWIDHGRQIRLAAVWGGQAADGKNAALENRIFSDATPCVNFDARIQNPEAAANFEVGKEFYVDFIPVPSKIDN